MFVLALKFVGYIGFPSGVYRVRKRKTRMIYYLKVWLECVDEEQKGNSSLNERSV